MSGCLVVASAVLVAACQPGSDNPDNPTGGHSGTGGSGGTELPDPLPLVVCNWNVHNFVNDVNENLAPQEEVDPGWPAHRVATGNVLAAINADVVVLQEVEHVGVLQDLVELELDGAYPYVTVIDGNDPRGIDVGVLSKVPLEQVVTHRDDSFTVEGTASPAYHYARDALEVHITFNGRPIVLFGVHFKAKENDDPAKRLAEAQHTRVLADAITAAAPGTGILILGDFNDTPGSPPYQATIGSGGDLYSNAADSVAQADRWSFDYQGKLELVDQQMANPLMAERLVPSSVRILHDPEVDPASDHDPVVATYLIN